jgi:succinyl-CoA synthetase alpha subunit
MEILSNKRLVIIQGVDVNGSSGYVKQMKSYGTNIVGVIVDDAQKRAGISGFSNVEAAVKETKADTSVVFSNPENVKKDVLAAIEVGIDLIVIVTEKVPLQDMIVLVAFAKQFGTRILGPGSAGLVVVDDMKLGIIPERIFEKGSVGIVCRSEILAYEVVQRLTKNNIGQSVFVDLGADAVSGFRFDDVLPLFEDDKNTKVIVLIGEIGGVNEERAAMLAGKIKKPIVALIAGKSAPKGKKMGHAGAMICGVSGSYESKYAALSKAGVKIADNIIELVEIVASLV